MAVLIAGDRTMAKKVGRPKKAGGASSQVRIEADLAKMSRAIADFKGASVSDYLDGLLREGIVRDYGKVLRATAPAGKKADG